MKNTFSLGEPAVPLAANFIKDGDVIALPTDTVYSFARLAQNNYPLPEFYSLKKNYSKIPVEFFLASANGIYYAHIDHLPENFLEELCLV